MSGWKSSRAGRRPDQKSGAEAPLFVAKGTSLPVRAAAGRMRTGSAPSSATTGTATAATRVSATAAAATTGFTSTPGSTTATVGARAATLTSAPRPASAGAGPTITVTAVSAPVPATTAVFTRGRCLPAAAVIAAARVIAIGAARTAVVARPLAAGRRTPRHDGLAQVQRLTAGAAFREPLPAGAGIGIPAPVGRLCVAARPAIAGLAAELVLS